MSALGNIGMGRATRALVTFAALAALAGPVAATQLLIPVVTNGAGTALATRTSVWLVDAAGEQVVGSTSTGLATQYTGEAITEDLTLTLAPTGSVTLPGGGPAFYRVRVAAGRALLDQTIELPDSESTVNLTELVADGSVWARTSILARTLPTDAVDGQIPVWDAATEAWVAATAAGTGDMLEAVYDPQGIAADAFAWANITGTPTTCDGYGITDCGGHDAVTLGGALDYLTLTGQQLTRGPIDLSTDVTGTLPWSAVGSTPTTLAGYGITDAATSTQGALADSAVQTEADPVYSADPAAGITAQDLLDWDAAYGWGDHSAAGYATAGLVAAPATPTDTCTAGQRAWSSPYLYTCVATDTWVRVTPERTW